MARLRTVQTPSVFAKRLRDARIKKGISQKQLGILAGIDEFTASSRVNQWERSRHTPDLAMVERLAQILEAPAPYFYARDDALAAWILAFPKTSIGRRKRAIKVHSKLSA
jgi:transcriptional regulator with XRE-family HTH domain